VRPELLGSRLCQAGLLLEEQIDDEFALVLVGLVVRLQCDRFAEVSYGLGLQPGVRGEVRVDAGDLVPRLTRALVRRFGDGLRPWRHDKLATGRALDHLAERGELDALVGPEGELTGRAYARIDALLAKGGT
jgi:hypothetical protein